MRNYELINLLGEAKATEKVKVHICLSLQELMNGEQIEQILKTEGLPMSMNLYMYIRRQLEMKANDKL